MSVGRLRLPDRVVSVFDADARPIKLGKVDRPTEFGYKVRLTESEEQLIAEYELFRATRRTATYFLAGSLSTAVVWVGSPSE